MTSLRDRDHRRLLTKSKNAKKQAEVMPVIERLIRNLKPDDIDSRLEIGLRYLTFGDSANAAYWLESAAELGNREAMFFIGKLDLEQRGEVKWLREAASYGDPDAALLLARHFARGKVLRRTDAEASMHWYEWLLSRGEKEIVKEYVELLLKSKEMGKAQSMIIDLKHEQRDYRQLVDMALRSPACTREFINAIKNHPYHQDFTQDSRYLFSLGYACNGVGDKKSAKFWFAESSKFGGGSQLVGDQHTPTRDQK
jgi:TPR repeat protein